MAPEEKLSPERAARVLRAFQGELEFMLVDPKNIVFDPRMLASRVAMICQILADHLEEFQELTGLTGQLAMLSGLPTQVEGDPDPLALYEDDE